MSRDRIKFSYRYKTANLIELKRYKQRVYLGVEETVEQRDDKSLKTIIDTLSS